MLGTLAAVTNASGRGTVGLPVPNAPLLLGAELFGQWGIDDPQGVPLPGLAGLAMSRGVRLRVGL